MERRAFLQLASSKSVAESSTRSDYDRVGRKKQMEGPRRAELPRNKEDATARLDNAMPAQALGAIEEPPEASAAPAAPAESAKFISGAYRQVVGQELKWFEAAPDMIQAAWQVTDVAAATAQVTEWVAAHEGVVVAPDDHHLSVTLPASDVPQFLAQFSTPPISELLRSDASRITISLELVSSQ